MRSMLVLSFRPASIYPVAIHAPKSARKSPRKAFPLKKFWNDGHVIEPACHTQASLIPTMIPPVKAKMSPTIAVPPTRSRNKIGANNVTHKGVVVTKTTELATVVYSRDVIQVAKCNARKMPDKRAKIHSRRFNLH